MKELSLPNKKEKQDYEFKGHDWTELAKAWNCFVPENEEQTEHNILSRLIDNIYCTGDKVDPQVIKDVRVWLTKTAEEAEKHCFCGPIVRGMLNVLDDQTLLSWVSCCLTRLWT